MLLASTSGGQSENRRRKHGRAAEQTSLSHMTPLEGELGSWGRPPRGPGVNAGSESGAQKSDGALVKLLHHRHQIPNRKRNRQVGSSAVRRSRTSHNLQTRSCLNGLVTVATRMRTSAGRTDPVAVQFVLQFTCQLHASLRREKWCWLLGNRL